MEIGWSYEEQLSCDGKVLGWAGCSVGAYEAVGTTSREPAVVGAEGLLPLCPGRTIRLRGHPIHHAVEVIEFVGELVKHHVGTSLRVGGVVLNRPPVEQDRSSTVPGLPGAMVWAIGHDATCRSGAHLSRHDRARVDNDRCDVPKRVGARAEPCREECRVSGDSGNHPLADGNVAGTFPRHSLDQSFGVDLVSGPLIVAQSPECGRASLDQVRHHVVAHPTSLASVRIQTSQRNQEKTMTERASTPVRIAEP